MKKIGIFFGTDSGSTRLVAKNIAKKLGPEVADKPVNINRTSLTDFMAYDVLILGTPSYGEGQVPGKSTGVAAGSWEEFLPLLAEQDLSDKLIALYGLGDQEKYPQRFANSLAQLYQVVKNCGASLIGQWSTDGYDFTHSAAVIDDKFVGLVIDQPGQRMLTEPRIEKWLDQIKPAMLAFNTTEAVSGAN